MFRFSVSVSVDWRLFLKGLIKADFPNKFSQTMITIDGLDSMIWERDWYYDYCDQITIELIAMMSHVISHIKKLIDTMVYDRYCNYNHF